MHNLNKLSVNVAAQRGAVRFTYVKAHPNLHLIELGGVSHESRQTKELIKQILNGVKCESPWPAPERDERDIEQYIARHLIKDRKQRIDGVLWVIDASLERTDDGDKELYSMFVDYSTIAKNTNMPTVVFTHIGDDVGGDDAILPLHPAGRKVCIENCLVAPTEGGPRNYKQERASLELLTSLVAQSRPSLFRRKKKNETLASVESAPANTIVSE